MPQLRRLRKDEHNLEVIYAVKIYLLSLVV